MATKRKIKATASRPKAEPSSKSRETVLVLRTCAADGTSSHGFKWPESGPVEAPDWRATAECGHGLHGWLWGHGDWRLKQQGDKIKWLVVEVEKASIIDLTGKVKFPKGNVLASFAAWNDAMKFIRARHPNDEATTTATGHSGHASATGDYGHASATGDYGHASATGDSGHASATGDYGHASATGDSGWSIAGYHGEAKAKEKGVITGIYFDDIAKRPRVLVGYVGEDGIQADTFYRIENAKWIEVKK